MTAPAHSGGDGRLCRGFGLITHDSAGGEGLRGIVKAGRALCGCGLAESVQAIYKLKQTRSFKFTTYLLDLANTS